MTTEHFNKDFDKLKGVSAKGRKNISGLIKTTDNSFEADTVFTVVLNAISSLSSEEDNALRRVWGNKLYEMNTEEYSSYDVAHRAISHTFAAIRRLRTDQLNLPFKANYPGKTLPILQQVAYGRNMAHLNESTSAFDILVIFPDLPVTTE